VNNLSVTFPARVKRLKVRSNVLKLSEHFSTFRSILNWINIKAHLFLKTAGCLYLFLLYSPLNPIYFNLIISPRATLQLRRACPIEVGRARLSLRRSHLQPPAECYNLQIKDITHAIDPSSALGDNIGRNVIISRRYRHRDKLATNLTDIWSSFRPTLPRSSFSNWNLNWIRLTLVEIMTN